MAPEDNGKLEMGQGWHCPYVQARIARRQKLFILNPSLVILSPSEGSHDVAQGRHCEGSRFFALLRMTIKRNSSCITG